MKSQKRVFLKAALAAAVLSAGGIAAAEDGVTANSIKIGTSVVLSGTSAAFGKSMAEGAEVYLGKVNSAGGVNGRKIEVVLMDDGYNPDKAVENTTKLLEQDKVFALFNYFGTGVSQKVMPMAAKTGVPFLFPYSGGEFLRSPVKQVVFNVRGSYYGEAESLVDQLQKAGAQKIAVFYQNDGFGEHGKIGAERAMARRSGKLAGVGTYERNTTDIKAGYDAVKATGADAVIMTAVTAPAAEFLKKAKADGWNVKIAALSPIGGNILKEPAAEGIYVSQVLPSPEDNRPLVKQFQADMKAAGKAANYESLEGYLNAAVMVEGLKAAGADLTRKSFISAMEGLNKDIGGVHVEFSDKNHQGMKEAFFTKVQGGKFVPVTSLK